MKRVVIDTNVLISATLSPAGNPARIIELISDKEIHLYYCQAIMDEYKRVLACEKLKITAELQNRTLKAIESLGFLVEPSISDISMPDESDRVFYDTAKESNSVLITGNTKHFPDEPKIMTPTEYWRAFLESEIKHRGNNSV